MNCREFAKKHDAYIDDTLNGVDIERMVSHLRFCEPCAQRDTRIRRSLLLAKNIPSIELSADFGARLQARLREERQLQHHNDTKETHTRHWALTPTAYGIIAVGFLMAAGVAGAVTLSGIDDDDDARMSAPVASMTQPGLSSPMNVASIQGGLPAWPAMGGIQPTLVQFVDEPAATR